MVEDPAPALARESIAAITALETGREEGLEALKHVSYGAGGVKR